jgi:hypothetical protein
MILHRARDNRTENAVLLLACGSWLTAIGQFIVEMSRWPEYYTHYLAIQLVISLWGLAGCLAWSRSSPRWRAVLVSAAGCYVLFFLLEYFWVRVAEFSGILSFQDAVWWPIYSTWSVVVHFFASGKLAVGLGVLFHEWLMPVFQLIVLAALVWPLAPVSRGEAPQPGRA